MIETETRCLRRDETFSMRPDRRGLALRAQRGILLVTQEGDAADYVLGAGDSFTTRRTGRVAVWALAEAALALGPAPAAAPRDAAGASRRLALRAHP